MSQKEALRSEAAKEAVRGLVGDPEALRQLAAGKKGLPGQKGTTVDASTQFRLDPSYFAGGRSRHYHTRFCIS